MRIEGLRHLAQEPARCEILHSTMDELAAERYRQDLCIRYVSGLRNQKTPFFQQVPRTPQPSEFVCHSGDSSELRLNITAWCSLRACLIDSFP